MLENLIIEATKEELKERDIHQAVGEHLNISDKIENAGVHNFMAGYIKAYIDDYEDPKELKSKLHQDRIVSLYLDDVDGFVDTYERRRA